MIDKTEVSKSEPLKNRLEIKGANGVFTISSLLIDLASDQEPLKLAITLEKVPQLIEDGIEINGIIIDRKSPKLQEMLKEAASLKEIPEKEKPRRLMELLRTNVSYAYKNIIDELSKTNPRLAEWIGSNIVEDPHLGNQITLSEIVDSGFGICRHLSVAMLALAKEADMEGVILNSSHEGASDGKYLQNILRKDNGQPLFKMGKVGDTGSPHAWVELKTKDGEWIPVDPSAQLVGDSPEGMETFLEANYRAVSRGVDITGFPSGSGVGYTNRSDLWFLSGETEHTGIVYVNTRSFYNKKQKITEPRSYRGPLSFRVLNIAPGETDINQTAGLYPKITGVKMA